MIEFCQTYFGSDFKSFASIICFMHEENGEFLRSKHVVQLKSRFDFFYSLPLHRVVVGRNMQAGGFGGLVGAAVMKSALECNSTSTSNTSVSFPHFTHNLADGRVFIFECRQNQISMIIAVSLPHFAEEPGKAEARVILCMSSKCDLSDILQV